MCFPKVAPGLPSAPSEDVNKIRMEVFGSIGFSSSFSLLVCADLHVLSSTAGSRWDLRVGLTRMEKYLGHDCQEVKCGGGVWKVDGEKCSCISFVVAQTSTSTQKMDFSPSLNCNDSFNNLEKSESKSLQVLQPIPSNAVKNTDIHINMRGVTPLISCLWCIT